MSKPKFSIDGYDLNFDWYDLGRYRGYLLYSHGDSIDQLFENATLEVIDQDGDTIDTLSLDDACNQVTKLVFKKLTKLVEGR